MPSNKLLSRKHSDKRGFVSSYIETVVLSTRKPLLVVEASSVFLIDLGGSNKYAGYLAHWNRAVHTHQIKLQL